MLFLGHFLGRENAKLYIKDVAGGISTFAPFYIEGALLSSFTFTPATFLSYALISIVSHSKSFYGDSSQLY